jgi:uncharacterized membrane protein
MLFLISFLTVGILLGLLIRKIAKVANTSEVVLAFLCYISLFILSVFFHLDEKVISEIDKIGWHLFAKIITGLSIIVIFIHLLYKLFKFLIQIR